MAKCPKCGNPRVKYLQKKPKKKKRTNFWAKCSKCGFKGQLKPLKL